MDRLVPAVQAELLVSAANQQQHIKSLARKHFKSQKAYNRFVALQAANKLPATLHKQLTGSKFTFRCPDRTVRENTQAAIDTLTCTYQEAVFKEMVDGYKDAADAAKQALDAAIPEASQNLLAAFNIIKQQQRHGSTDPRMQATYRHIQVDMEAAIAAMLVRMRDSIIGRPPPPPPPAATAAAGQQAGAAGEAEEAMQDGDDDAGPANQEAAAPAEAQQAAAAPVLTKAEVEQLITEALKKAATKSRNNQPRLKAQPKQRQQQQQPRHNQQQPRQFVVLQEPMYQGYVNKPRQQRYKQQRHLGNQQGRYNHQQPQQQQYYQPAAFFQQGPLWFPRPPNPNNYAGPGGPPTNVPGIPRGRNGGNRSTTSGTGAGGGRPRQNQLRYR